MKRDSGFTRNANGDSGQMMLITLLVLTIALTVALSLIGRSTTDTALTTQVEESARAFSAAEAGIEEALKAGGAASYTLESGVAVDVAVTQAAGAVGFYELPKKIGRGETATIWLVNHDANGKIIETRTFTDSNISVCWSRESTAPAVEVSVFYKESTGEYRVARGAYDADGNRRTTNNFSDVTNPGSGTGPCQAADTMRYRTVVTFSTLSSQIDPAVDTLLALRIKPLYSDATVSVRSGSVIPSQGKRIESVGKTVTGITRKIVVTQDYRAPSGLFDYVIFSPSTIRH